MMLENLEKTRTQMRRGVLELCVLSIIAETDEVYPTDIKDKLANSQLIVVEGTLYPLLTRLKNGGLLTYNWQESTQGPPRKYYSITDQGRNFLAGLQDTWQDLVQVVLQITQNQHQR